MTRPSSPTGIHRSPMLLGCAVFLSALVLIAIIGPRFAPFPPDQQDLRAVFTGPSSIHLLGTDGVGRDVLSRLLVGVAPTLVGAIQAMLVYLAIGVPIGILAGYRGGRWDQAITRVADLVLAIPPIIIILVVIVIADGSSAAAMATLGLLGSPGLVRVVRAAAGRVREQLFVTSARVSGVSTAKIMRTHVLRRIRGPVIVQSSLFCGMAILFQAGLSFLGLVAQDRPTWGGVLSEGAQAISQSQWLIIPPGVAITATVLALGLLGDALRDLSADDAPRRRRRRVRTGLPMQQPVADAPDDALLRVHGLVASLDDGTPLVTDVTFHITPGETLGLVGESGCGKSVTALSVLGLLPEGIQVTAGSVHFQDVDLVAGGTAAYRPIRGSGIAYISQDPMSALDPVHSIGAHLEEIIKLHDRSTRSARRDRAADLLRMVQIPDVDRVLAAYPHQISGGMAQRVGIAIALAGRPALLIADEPTTALDVTVQAEILALLRMLQDTTELALLLVTHDWGVVADICDRVVVMYAGEIVEVGPIADVFATPAHPYTEALLSAEPSHAEPLTRLRTLAGRVPDPGTWPDGCRFRDRCAHAIDRCGDAPIMLLPVPGGSTSRCIRVDALQAEVDA